MSNIKFAVIADPHLKLDITKDLPKVLNPYGNVKENRTSLESELKSLSGIDGIDFVICLGDNIDDLYQPPAIGRSHKSYEIATNFANLVEQNFGTSVPFYLTLGNHDLREYKLCKSLRHLGNIYFDHHGKDAAEMWDNILNDSGYPSINYPSDSITNELEENCCYYAWKLKGYLFVVLNTSLYDSEKSDGPMNLGEKQWRWLDNILSNNEEPTFLFSHSNQFGLEASHFDILKRNQNKIKGIFVGHAHTYKEFKVEGTNIQVYQTTAVFKPAPKGQTKHYLVTVDNTGNVTVDKSDKVFTSDLR